MLWIILLLGLTIKFFPDVIHGQTIISHPVHLTGTVGGSATFTCQVEFTGVQKFFSWEFNNNPIYIHQYDVEDYPLGEKKYSVKKESGTFALTVKDLVCEDGGHYSCLVLGQARAAVLLVLGTPHLSISSPSPLEGSATWFICTAKLGGPKKEDILPEQYPQLQMFFEGKSLNGTVKEQDLQGSMNIFNLTKIYNITLALHMDGKELTCDIKSLKPVIHINVTTYVTVLRPTEIPAQDSGNDSWKIGMAFAIPMLLIIAIAGVAAFCYRKSLGKLIRRKDPSEEVNTEEDTESKEFEDQGESFVAEKKIDPNNDTDHSVVIALGQVVLDIPPKSVAKCTSVFVKINENSHARQQQIESSGLDNILKSVVQLSLEPFEIKLSQPAQIQVTKKDKTEHSNTLVFSRQKPEDQWTDITAVCDIEIRQDAISFKIDTFAEFEIFLSSLNREDASRHALTLLNSQQPNSPGEDESMELLSIKQTKHTTTTGARKSGKERQVKSKKLVKTIEALKCSNDLDEATAKTMKQIINDKNGNPPVQMFSALNKLLNKADILIESNHFVDVCKAAAKKCIEIPEQMHEDPLLVLVEKLEKADSSYLTQYQDRLLHLTEILQQCSSSNDTRSRCIRVLVMNTVEWRQSQGEVIDEKDKSSSKQLQLNFDLIYFLKGLGEKGADPAWTPEDSSNGSNLHLVMAAVKYVISYKSELYRDCMDLLEVMMTMSSLGWNNIDSEGMTVLHALVNGRKFPILPNCAAQLVQIITFVKKKNSDLIDTTNDLKHTPLHTFLTSVLTVPRNNATENEIHLFAKATKQWRANKEGCLQVIKCLISPTNKDIQSKAEKTPLHDLIECVDEWQDNTDTFLELIKLIKTDFNTDFYGKNTKPPIFEFVCKAKVSKYYQHTFLEIMKCLRSAHNIDFQSKEISTPLFEFTTGAAEWADKPTVFLEIVKYLKSPTNTEFKGQNGFTPLHMIICTTTNWVSHSDEILALVKFLRSASNVNYQDEQGCTPLHLMISLAAEWANNPGTLVQLIESLKSNSNTDILNKNKETPLSSFTDAAGKWASHPNIFLEVMKRLKSPANINKQNKNGCTPLHLVTSKAGKWQDHPAIYLEVIKWLISNHSVNALDMQGNTPLINFIKEAVKWTNNTDSILEVFKLLISQNNVNLKNENGNTPLHQLTSAAAEWAKHPNAFLEAVNGLKSKDNINFINVEGYTPIHYMTSAATDQWIHYPEEFLKIVKSLLSPTNIDLKTEDGNTPLHYVTCVTEKWVRNPDTFLKVVSCLVSSSNIEIQNNLGCTPLHNVTYKARLWAEKSGIYLKIVECLISPTNVNLQNKHGHTPLHAFNEDIKNLNNKPISYTEVADCLKSGQKKSNLLNFAMNKLGLS